MSSTAGSDAYVLVLEGEALLVSLLPSRGADIYELIDRRSGQDVLFKAPWGGRPRGAPVGATSSETRWFDSYRGGWNLLFPSGGAACSVLGAELPFHGEASVSAWEVISTSGSGGAHLGIRLARSPLRIERRVSVDERRPVLTVRERVTNEGQDPYPYQWTHHPTLGSRLLAGSCRIDTAARSVHVDPGYNPPGNALRPGATSAWPLADGPTGLVDLSLVPGPGASRSLLAYISDFDDGWYAVSNDEAGIGFALRWPTEMFPHAWFWQELNASADYPWFRAARAIAIEPSTTFPADGLAGAIARGGNRTLQPGESAEVVITAAVFRPAGRVQTVTSDGNVRFS